MSTCFQGQLNEPIIIKLKGLFLGSFGDWGNGDATEEINIFSCFIKAFIVIVDFRVERPQEIPFKS